jgi:predicted amidohydrolase
MVVDPWGKVESSLEDEEEILIADIDLGKVAKVRRELPLLAHRRTDLYRISEGQRFQGGEDGDD